MSRTPAGAGNRKLIAFRTRIKRTKFGTAQVIASAGTASIDKFYFDSSDRLCLDVLGSARLVTTQVFRDPTAWTVDVGFILDVANGTAGSRAKILIDGAEVSSYSTDGRASITNTDTNWNNTVVHYIGRDNSGNYLDAYLSEPIGVDGSTTVTAYSETTGGIRTPVRPSATYGTNGFYLDFANGASAAELGYDAAGSNDFTVTNISVTAGTGNDWLEDTPTNNYATLNPLARASGTHANGALQYSIASATGTSAVSTIGVSTGKWVWEFTITATGSGFPFCGAYRGNFIPYLDTRIGVDTNGFVYGSTDYYVDTTPTNHGGSVAANDVIRFELDCDAHTCAIYKNNSLVVSLSSLASGTYYPGCIVYNGTGFYFNAGQRAFANTPNTGFQALNTANLNDTTGATSGSFTGDANANGPVVYIGGEPDTLTIDGNAVTWGTHADKLAGGFKIRTAAAGYNDVATNNWTATIADDFVESGIPNTAQGN
jgi:hypothetical protein